MDKRLAFQIKNLSKNFPGVKALDGISLDIYSHEVHSLVGENGAGKSTLMNILSGVYKIDEGMGEIQYFGNTTHFKSAYDAKKCGIAMIHQELSIATNMSVVENIFIGRYKKGAFGLVSNRKMIEESREYLKELGIDNINPNTLLKNLSVSQRQLVEIAKALALNAKVIIMDEPTSSLTTHETERLIDIILRLKQTGVAILYISHKLEEVFKISDRISVLRDGKLVNTFQSGDVTPDTVISLMVGRDLAEAVYVPSQSIKAQMVLEVENLNWKKRLTDVSFNLRKGEILGLAGLVGSGRSELAMSIVGALKKDSGVIRLNGKEVLIDSPNKAIKMGISLLPEDRKMQSLFLNMKVVENITISNLKSLSKFNFIKKKREQKVAEDYVESLRVKTPSISQRVKNLSGGNQQKTIIARWLFTGPKILIMDEPTHGVDIGAKSEIYDLMRALVKKGVSIILISSELPEIIMMCDRIAVMANGRINAILDRDSADSETIMKYATKQIN